jgi:hypothetical protein
MESLDILSALGIPRPETELRAQRMALAFRAVAHLRPDSPWAVAVGAGDPMLVPMKTRDIISFLNSQYGTSISPGSYDDIRRRDLRDVVLAGIVLKSAGDPSAGVW